MIFLEYIPKKMYFRILESKQSNWFMGFEVLCLL